MDVGAALLKIHESDDTASAYAALSTAFEFPLTCVLRVTSANEPAGCMWPADAQPSRELIDTAAHVLRPEVFGLRSQFPADAAVFPDADALMLPYRVGDTPVCAVLIGAAGAFGEEGEPWRRLAGALQRAEEREGALVRLRSDCEQLRRRAEESEALHTLGLATNRSLDPTEVLALVTRFARTLLGAHYATVHTTENGMLRRVASIGLRDDAAVPLDGDALADLVVRTEKPTRVGCDDSALRPVDFPAHEAEGMVVGLGVPLTLFGDTFGALIAGYRRAYDISPRDVRLGISVATHAAVALANARLHERVEQRSQELADAYDKLDNAVRAKERFFNAVSHDLRTPVGAVKGYSELLLEGLAGELPDKARRYVENSHRAAEALLSLLNDLLDFAKIQAGRMEVDFAEASLRTVLDDSFVVVRPQAAACGLRLIEPELDDDVVLHTDAKRLRQILVNLLSNAIKFTAEGEVGMRVDRLPDGWIELTVFDTGAGIPDEHLERIFQEFEQIKGSVGTGLGLPICRTLAELLGGTLRVESEVGKGSSFVVGLPGIISDEPPQKHVLKPTRREVDHSIG